MTTANDFPIGTRVKLSGLNARSDLNATLGWVVEPDVEEKAILADNGRVKVAPDAQKKKPLSIKPANLLVVTIVETSSEIDWSIMVTVKAHPCTMPPTLASALLRRTSQPLGSESFAPILPSATSTTAVTL